MLYRHRATKNYCYQILQGWLVKRLPYDLDNFQKNKYELDQDQLIVIFELRKLENRLGNFPVSAMLVFLKHQY